MGQSADTATTPGGSSRHFACGEMDGTVLFVGDDADMRVNVTQLLSPRYEVRTASSATEALNVIKETRPDLVLTDLMLQEPEDFGLLRDIRSDPELETLSVIVLSASSDKEARAEGFERGADDLLVKPFSARELVATVSAHVAVARRHSERTQRHQRERVASLLNNAPIGIFTVDADRRITDVNLVAMRSFEKVRGGVVGRDFDKIIHVLWENEYADEIVRVFRHTLETGEPHAAPVRAELRIDHGVAEYYEWRLDRIVQPDGRFGVVCYFREISAQVLARAAIAESEDQRRRAAEGLRAIAARARCLLWYGEVEDRGDRGLAWTVRVADEEAARRFLPIDLPPGHTFGRALAEARLPEDRARLAWGDAETRAGRSYRQEYRVRDTDGNIRWLAEDVQIETIAPNRWYAVGITLDVTEGKWADVEREKHLEEIETLNHRLRRAMQETHHRVKNNLQVIAAMVDLQIMEDEDQVPLAEFQRLNRHIRALAAIHDLLTRDGKRDALLEVMSAKEGVERVLSMLETMSTDKHFVRRLEEVAVPITQGASLAILVNELVINAVKHGSGQVEVTLTCHNGRARLEVCDDGPGFPPGFNPSTSANTGLELVENVSRWDLGGETRYENRDEGGARVVVDFPLTATIGPSSPGG